MDRHSRYVTVYFNPASCSFRDVKYIGLPFTSSSICHNNPPNPYSLASIIKNFISEASGAGKLERSYNSSLKYIHASYFCCTHLIFQSVTVNTDDSHLLLLYSVPCSTLYICLDQPVNFGI